MGAAKQARDKIAFVGGGNMANALVRGLLADGRPARTIVVAEPVAAKRSQLKRRYKIAATASNRDAVAGARIVVLAVKPQQIDAVLEELADAIGRACVVVSIAAGVKVERIEAALGAGIRVVRSMPNTPALVGRGATVLYGGANARKADVAAAREIFRAVGIVHVVADEKLMDAVTALSGSGPAYVYRFAEGLIEAGVRSGLPRALAIALAYQTIAGAAEMLSSTGESPQALREAVSSPGGTTLAGLAALDERGFYDAIVAGVDAAKRRSQELGRRA
jgi:pyrroline-5-carboxylate reductase